VSFQVGQACYPTEASAASASASQAVGSIVSRGGDSYSVSVPSVSGTSITYTLTPLGGGSSITTVAPYTPQPCQMLSLGDGLQLGWMIAAAWLGASVHIKPVRSIPWMLAVMVLALITVAVMTFFAYSAISRKMNPQASISQGQTFAPGQTTAPGQTPVSAHAVPDESVDFIPRMYDRPWTAPAYDELRKVANMPRIAGGIAMGKRVRCFTQQGTDAGITEDACREWLLNPPFDPYTSFASLSPPPTPVSPPAATPAPVHQAANETTGFIDHSQKPGYNQSDLTHAYRKPISRL